MTINKYFGNRRKKDRFSAKEGAFVEFNKPYKPRLFNLGKPRTAILSAQIIDISSGGLAFQYVDHEMWSHDYGVLSISISHKKNNKIVQVPFRVVSDFTITKLSNSKFKRRCGVKFGRLTYPTKFQLYSFINAHALGMRSKDDRRQFFDPHHNGSERRKRIERRKIKVASNI
jgi:hypothetical protein